MEMVEKIVDIAENEVLVNTEPEFVENSHDEVSATFFVLCEENNAEFGKNLYEYDLLGIPMLNWVQKACLSRPMIIKTNENTDIISLIKPYTKNEDYSVVLYANTPLLSREHLKDLLAYAKRTNRNVLKLKRGFIFNNDYLRDLGEIYSTEVFNFVGDDFFEVKSFNDFEDAKYLLHEKLLKYHATNFVEFLGLNQNIDATVQIDEGAKIFGGVVLKGKSCVGADDTIGANVVVANSKLGDSVVIEDGSIVINSVIKTGAKIGAGSIVKNSVIWPNVELGIGSRVESSAFVENVKVGSFATVIAAKIDRNLDDGEIVSRKV